MIEFNARPGERRNFIHKRIIGAVGGFLTGGPAGAISGAVFTGSDRGAGLGGSDSTARSRRRDASLRNFCATATPPLTPSDAARCRNAGLQAGATPTPGIVGAVQRILPGGATGFEASFGEAVMGPFGAALVPVTFERTVSRCLGGMVLAGPPGGPYLCYNKGTRGVAAFRKWPPGTKPFLTGGDVKCLRRANTLRRSKGSKRLLKELGF